MTSLYAQYIKEREGLELLEHPHGFATYEIGDDFVYIIDIFILKEHRSQHLATKIADEIVAKSGKSKVIGSVDTNDKNYETNLKVLKAYGMREYKTKRNMIYMIKEV